MGFLPEAQGEIIDDLDTLIDPKPEPKKKIEKEPEKAAPEDKSEEKPKESKKAPSKKTSKKKMSDEERQKLPIKLKSDGQLTYSRGGKIAHLVKNVRVSQGNLSFRSDEAKAYFVEIDGENVAEKVEIFGNVRFAKYEADPRENIKASGNRALFLNRQRKVTLIGNARLWQGGHLIKGKQITYDIQTGIIKVDRAEGVLQPEEQNHANPAQ